MHRWRAAQLVILAAMFPGAAAGTELFTCPTGTEQKSGAGDMPGGRKEWCVDSKTGLKEGPERQLRANGGLLVTSTNLHGKSHGTGYVYGESGEKLAESTFNDNGVLVSQRMTLAGLKSVVDNVNRMGREQKTPFQLEAIDLHTLAFEVRLDGATPNAAADRYLRENAPRTPQICQMFKVPGVSIETIRAHYVNEKKESLTRLTIARDDCVATPAK